MKDIAIYGAGGFGREIACMIMQINQVRSEWNLIGFFDDETKQVKPNRYGRIIGNADVLNKWPNPLSVVFSIANPQVLDLLNKKLTNTLLEFPNIAAPNVNFFDRESLLIGKGNVFFFGCRVSCDVAIGNFNLFNGAVSIGHDVSLGDFNVFQPSTRISGGCRIGNCNFFGVQSVVLQGVRIGNNNRIGAYSVVLRNTQDNNTYFGNPAKKFNF